MGRGGYLGGGTIIRPGLGWFSNDSRRDDPPPSGKSKLVAGGRSSATAAAIAKKAKRPKVDDQVLWSNYVSAIVSAQLQKRPPPNPPKQIKEAVLQISGQPGGIAAWVKDHPEYTTILARLRKRHGSAARIVSSTPGRSRSPTEAPEQPRVAGRVHPELSALKKEMDVLLARLAAAQDTVRGIEEEIRDVDGRIKFAARLIAPTVSSSRG